MYPINPFFEVIPLILLALGQRLSKEPSEAKQRAMFCSLHKVHLPSFVVSSTHGCGRERDWIVLACIFTRVHSCSLGSFQA